MPSDPSASKAAKLGLRHIRVHFGTFDFSMICIVGKYDAALKFAAWKHDWPTDQFTVSDMAEAMDRGYEPRGRIFRRADQVPIIWIPRKPKTAREHGTLAHEILHAVRLLMHWAAMELNEHTEEAYCHALGHGVTTVLEALKGS